MLCLFLIGALAVTLAAVAIHGGVQRQRIRNDLATATFDLAEERAEVARLRGEVETRLAVLEERARGALARDEEARKLTLSQFDAIYRQAKGLTQQAARQQAENRKAAETALEDASRLVGQFQKHYLFVRDFAADPRINRLLNERVVPQIPEDA